MAVSHGAVATECPRDGVLLEACRLLTSDLGNSSINFQTLILTAKVQGEACIFQNSRGERDDQLCPGERGGFYRRVGLAWDSGWTQGNGARMAQRAILAWDPLKTGIPSISLSQNI